MFQIECVHYNRWTFTFYYIYIQQMNTTIEMHHFYINKSSSNFIIISIFNIYIYILYLLSIIITRMKKKIFSICASLSLCASSSECFCLISLAVDEPIIEAVHIRKYTANRQHICMFLYVYSSLEYIHTCTQGKKAVDGIRMEESSDQQRTLMRKKAIDFD